MADYVKSSGSFSIQAHNFCERLCNDHLKSIINEIAKTPCVIVKAARGETLIGSVKEGVKLVLFANIKDFLPFIL